MHEINRNTFYNIPYPSSFATKQNFSDLILILYVKYLNTNLIYNFCNCIAQGIFRIAITLLFKVLQTSLKQFRIQSKSFWSMINVSIFKMITNFNWGPAFFNYKIITFLNLITQSSEYVQFTPQNNFKLEILNKGFLKYIINY